MYDPISRRDALRFAVAGLAAGTTEAAEAAPDPNRQPSEATRPFLTQGESFQDVSRGKPIPHSLKGEALIKARLTDATWRLEIAAEGKAEIQKPLRIADGTALDFPSLVKLGQTKGVKFLKAMQCNNIAQPLGQGLWEGVPLREVLKSVGKFSNTRRVDFWGFHNNDPNQMFRSTLAINQVLDTPPGELPPFVAYRLNGEPIPLKRGGPVRMVVPWAHGFKSIKWLQNIVLTDDYHASDTYALQNNDPESYLKTAAYIDNPRLQTVHSGKPVLIQGTAMVGWPGLDRVEYWLRPASGNRRADPRRRSGLEDGEVATLPYRAAAGRLGRRPARGRPAQGRLGVRRAREAQAMATPVQRGPLVGDTQGPEAGAL